MVTVSGMATSGNCWKVAQILRFRDIAYVWREIDSTHGETRTPAFMAMNPNGKVPLVELDDGTRITESNAILAHFAEGSRWLPPPGLPRTRVFEWLFFEQYSHEPYVAVARNLITLRGEAHLHAERLAQCRVGGEAAFGVMERRLASHAWLTDEGPTIADIALFAYSQVAGEGGFRIADWPGVESWLARMRALPGLVAIS